ncbi:polysaccharide export protein EpsE [Janthinobacterium sp. 17J80-10]|uniref:polysaccharide export protein EpsE n=1 Tax=Janthinobacterium sp. 17J80-10 TaxID=2497863 RepID=UPI00100569A6|nr:polysaccharide export protein EpsE [Janthinobacterium sp. 17J80-10]QAU34438.1 polysaccharide export protein EpsE [Janthinobacterium sp. 17J80-10]
MKSYFKWMLALITFLVVGAAAAADIELGPGDTLRVNVYGHPDLSLETRVSESGSISYPLIGEVKVSGLSPAEAQKKIAGMLERGGYLRNPQVNISVAQNQSQQVSVLGQVTRPGRYPVDGKRSLTDILALAGGTTQDAGDVVTLVRTRNGKTVKESLDLHSMVRTGDMHKNLQLKTDDVIYVERAPRFYIYGEVQHPGTYKLERNMTVIQALSVGGGLSPRGTDRGVRLKRRDADGTLREITAKHEDIVQTDDVVYVRESLF